MREYPKIETVFVRDERTKKVDPTRLRLAEFGLIREFHITEKIDGTNIRIGLTDTGQLQIGGRTDNAQVPAHLLSYLMDTFKPDVLREKFEGAPFTIFGEGYGPKIQSGGDYSPTPRYRIFDVLVGEWWLEPENVTNIAASLGVSVVPRLGVIAVPPDLARLQELLPKSRVPGEDGGRPRQAEGIVARPVPMLCNRRGHRLLWKLKFKDF